MGEGQRRAIEAREKLVELAEVLLQGSFPRNDVEYVCAAINNLDSLRRSWVLREQEQPREEQDRAAD